MSSRNDRALALAAALTCAATLGACAAGTTRSKGGQPEQVFQNRNPRRTALVNWPIPAGEKAVDLTIRVRDTFDGGMLRYYGIEELGTNDQAEDQPPLFDLDDGATLSNVILGDPAADGVHCKGKCTLINVWWERVGEDAATFRGKDPNQVSIVNGGGASGAMDKVFQHNGSGTLIIQNFYVEWFGKLYRSCGNCSTQTPRRVIVDNITAVTGPKSKAIVGINQNLGDTAEFRGTSTIYDKRGKLHICLKYKGNSSGLEPKEIGDGPDGQACKYRQDNVVVHR